MYRRYAPNPNPRQKPIPQRPQPVPPSRKNEKPHHALEQGGNLNQDAMKKKQGTKPKNPIFGLVPTSVYNPETKKVLGMFTAEDLLLAGLIFLLLENEENDDPMLVYALLYILISDYIDLPF